MKDEKQVEFDSPLRSLDWDNYQSSPSFSTICLEQMSAGIDSDNVVGNESVESEDVFADTSEAELVEFNMGRRRSKRVRKPYPYRGISDFLANDSDDFTSIEEEESVSPSFRPARTLTEDSRLEEVVQKGHVARRNREKRTPPRTEIDIHLPSVEVFNYSTLLQPRKPLVPEAVMTEKCQNLENALENLYKEVGDSVQGAVGGED